MVDNIRIFISYSHDSDEHRERVLQLAERLRSDGAEVRTDHDSPSPEEGWARWVVTEFARARFVLVVCSAHYTERFDTEHGRGSGVYWEGSLIYKELYDHGN